MDKANFLIEKGFVDVPVELLAVADWNYKKENKKLQQKLKNNFMLNGQVENLLIRELDTGFFEVINGNHRLIVMRELKMHMAHCYNFGVISDAKAKRIAIETNETKFDTDEEKLSELLKEIEENFDFSDMESTMAFTEAELVRLLEKANIRDTVEDDFDADEAYADIKEPVSKEGDLWLLGDHRLYCGDSTDKAAVLELMSGHSAPEVDLFLTDPPYNVDYVGKTEEALKIQNDVMDKENYKKFLVSAFTNANLVMKAGAVFYIWHADIESFIVRGACEDIDWKVRQVLIWNKNTMVMGRQDYHWKHEPCLYGWKSGAAHMWASDRRQTTVLEFSRPSKSREYPTMKPVEMFAYQIKNNTKGGDLILDLFAGSGTTIIAAEQLKRRAYCMEIDPKYCDVIIKRWETFTGNQAKKTD